MAQQVIQRRDDLGAPSAAAVVADHQPAPAQWDLPTVEVVGHPGEHTGALAAYLALVGAHLHALGVVVEHISVFAPTPHRALSASMVLRVASSGEACCAGWHEELGWWVGTHPLADTDMNIGPDAWSVPCWLGVLLPAAHRAAELLHAGLSGCIDTAVPARALRYRFGDEHALLADLEQVLPR